MMDLDELQSVRDRERQTDKLQQLRESFYADAGEFIQQLRRERERVAERTDDPFDSPEVNRLTDEINTAEGTVEAVFERRIGKIVKAASLAAADQPMDAAGMTAEETVLFEDLVDDIVGTRHRVFDTLDGESAADTAGDHADHSPVRSAGPAAETDATTPHANGGEARADSEAETGHEGAVAAEPGADGVAAADLMGGGSAAGAEGEPGTGTEREPETGPGAESVRAAAGPAESDTADDPGSDTPVRKDGGTVARETVRITDDIGEILGVDEREYDLVTDDVVQLPAENARPLVERGAAEQLE